MGQQPAPYVDPAMQFTMDPSQQFMAQMMDPTQQMPMMVMGPGGQFIPIIPMELRGMRWPDEMVPPQMMGDNSVQGIPAAAVPQSAPAGSSNEAPQEGGDDVPRPPASLTRQLSAGSGACRIHWTVPAQKLRTADRSAISPPFELSCGNGSSDIKFKLMLFPKVTSDAKGGSSFKKAKGKGFMQLKCEADLDKKAGTLLFRLYVGSQEPRGPVTHDFSQSAVKGLPQDLETWDLTRSIVTEGSSPYFVIGAEIIPRGGW